MKRAKLGGIKTAAEILNFVGNSSEAMILESVRGFDADHGTDVAIFADGVPVNMTSHGHGQGYADTHWMIPETIASVDVHKGPYAARYGDFYTAGAIPNQPTASDSSSLTRASPPSTRHRNARSTYSHSSPFG